MVVALKKHWLVLQKTSFWSTAKRYQELLAVLIPQNLHTRYRGSFLGVYWSLLNPLTMTGLYTAIFGATFASYYGDSIINYTLAAFTGLLITNFFSGSTSQALGSIVANGSLLNKIRLPLPVFPLTMIGVNVFQFLVGSFPLLAIVTLVNSQNIFYIPLLLIPFLALVLVCTGVGLFMAALYVFFRDLGYFYEIATFILWITSPVFYPAEIVPENIQPFLHLNPLVPIIESLREISLQSTIPTMESFARSFLGGIIILAFGWFFFQRCKSAFIDLL
ncbi:ABC transporter permease [Cyanobacterium stanieri LEGE 03274]|uniref:Transport permease protein n=1 Tax=Cyanobacterium stanieri LEGE 03274 TaxID=1828756 RepID=A0ABR9V6H8_9CHRO|nr:ABC transporter permease [Cyanobacterium stanieri]MBE9222454.1 ABC transporter permease [Cyanobacterium stanieri LEGE 03274]